MNLHPQVHSPEKPVETPEIKPSPKKLPFPKNAFSYSPLNDIAVRPNPQTSCRISHPLDRPVTYPDISRNADGSL